MPTTTKTPSRVTPSRRAAHPKGGAASSSLDTQETNVADQPNSAPWDIDQQRTAAEVNFRHSGWQDHRRRIALAIANAGLSDNRWHRFATCGTTAWIVRHPDHLDKYTVRSSHCRDRFCVPCAREKSHRVAQNVAKHTLKRTIRFITLTLRHSQASLTVQLAHLINSFRRLRTTSLWRATTQGGVAFLELKLGRNGREWHPHLHILCEGAYIRQSALAHEWHRITQDSYIVDIRRPKSQREVIYYVTKYAGKPMGQTLTYNAAKLATAIKELAARRLMTTFGTWRGFRLSKKAPAVDWIPVAPLARIIQLANAGLPWAVNLLATLRGQQPWNRPKPQPRQRPPPILRSACSF